MVQVYDMVTYGMYDPDEITRPCGRTQPTVMPALQLQTLQLTPSAQADTLPPSLRAVDIDRFLDACSD